MENIALICSTGGAVARTVLKENPNQKIKLLITDRKCGVENLAVNLKIPHVRIIEKENDLFSNKLNQVLNKNNIDYALFFFTRLLKGEILNTYNKRLINFHPSLLPAHPGLNGFDDSINSESIIIGSTVHFIDNGIDTGKQLWQSICSTIGMSEKQLRHIIFSQQCALLFETLNAIQKNTLNKKHDSIKENKLSDAYHSSFSPTISSQGISLYERILLK